MSIVKVQARLSALQLAQTIGRSWGTNDMSSFLSLFAQDATIIHPFFQEPISPTIAADVMNATVCGTTEYKGFVLLAGEGDGRQDIIEMYFDETGEAANYNPSYIGRMSVRAKLVDHRFTELCVRGYELIQRFPTRRSPLQRDDLGQLNTLDLSRHLVQAWTTNDMNRFVSLFAKNAPIMHPLFASPITPEIAADVLNSATRATSILQPLRLITGDGSGEYDTVNLFVYETGQEGGYIPNTAGILHMTAKIIDHRIEELFVHGYTPTPAVTNPDISPTLCLESFDKQQAIQTERVTVGETSYERLVEVPSYEA
ncbi:MAG: hypothetical protein IM550_06600 [Microcystis sp. M54BS1]|jgi:hypothetical protein|uniref:hypothetical protein n=1 Tax=unclassified Microcystis TaxID=2643300 RepID=UPI002580F7DB|nr:MULTISPECIES: hypothetical protein [unclassified Microcystis]MCA2538910.1 hypothetical protein [Microcystis sp. M54BS1]MCA2596554.1 hypothetical protein [Microcystis sp. M38BS1]MCA2611969.1 hypothetical protein [Microcystis sp. M27BS1]NCR76462.1 hypothetical protein [Microcystis aeruginosa K13-06]MCA2504785.1 hypothetical protein [Microcystis sp. M62BS1]